jgi:hypothetical protein
MPTSRPFAYNTGATISGTIQVGNVCVGVADLKYATNPGGLRWYNGPDEDLGYIVAVPATEGRSVGNMSPGLTAQIAFKRSPLKTEASYVSYTNYTFGNTFASSGDVVSWLNANGRYTSFPGIGTTGMILNYAVPISNSYPGSGATVNDLVGNSNAELVNSPGYTSSNGGYLTFNGTDQYLLTSTNLNPKLSPANTSTVISVFVWFYPMDNGVIVSELGQRVVNASWHDSQMELAGGQLRAGVWPYTSGIAPITSSIATPLNNWYYAGYVYNGTTLTLYVNGATGGSATYGRNTPYNTGGSLPLFYAIAALDSTSFGDGTYANMRFGGLHIYNIALSHSEILNNYNVTKARYGL